MYYPVIVENAYDALTFQKVVEYCPNCETKIFVDPYDPFNVGYTYDGNGKAINTIYCQSCDFPVLTEDKNAEQQFIED